MTIHARYVHLGLAARDWQALARFYEQVFGCVPLLDEREYLEPAPMINNMPPQPRPGVHLRLPGYGQNGPTLAIYQAPSEQERAVGGAEQPAVSHLAFSVPDVARAAAAVVSAGGSLLGPSSVYTAKNGMRLTYGFVADPEGNRIELQSWSYE